MTRKKIEYIISLLVTMNSVARLHGYICMNIDVIMCHNMYVCIYCVHWELRVLPAR